LEGLFLGRLEHLHHAGAGGLPDLLEPVGIGRLVRPVRVVAGRGVVHRRGGGRPELGELVARLDGDRSDLLDLRGGQVDLPGDFRPGDGQRPFDLEGDLLQARPLIGVEEVVELLLLG
jgi:hypothetical protein